MDQPIEQSLGKNIVLHRLQQIEKEKFKLINHQKNKWSIKMITPVQLHFKI